LYLLGRDKMIRTEQEIRDAKEFFDAQYKKMGD
jgi:hypothetical protein